MMLAILILAALILMAVVTMLIQSVVLNRRLDELETGFQEAAQEESRVGAVVGLGQASSAHEGGCFGGALGVEASDVLAVSVWDDFSKDHASNVEKAAVILTDGTRLLVSPEAARAFLATLPQMEAHP